MKVFKEIVVSIIILIIILIAMGIILYDKLPALKKIPKAQEYSKSLEAEKVLEEVINQDETKTAIKTYRMNKSEIKALSSSRRFEKGKSNPFAEYNSEDNGSSSNDGGSGSGSGSGSSGSSGGKIFDEPNGK